MDEQKNWGGRREGAGRPKREKGKPCAFVTTPEADAVLNSGRLPVSKTRFLNDAVVAYARQLGLI